MKSKIVLTGAVAGAMAMGAVGMIAAPSANALDLGLGGGSHTSAGVNAGGAGVSTNNRVGVRGGVNNDASGGIMARSRTNVSANTDNDTYDRDRADAEQDARFHSGISSRTNADTSAGADENADLRAQIRNDTAIDARDAADANANARVGANTNVNTGLLGLSVGSNTRAGVRGGYND